MMIPIESDIDYQRHRIRTLVFVYTGIALIMLFLMDYLTDGPISTFDQNFLCILVVILAVGTITYMMRTTKVSWKMVANYISQLL